MQINNNKPGFQAIYINPEYMEKKTIDRIKVLEPKSIKSLMDVIFL